MSQVCISTKATLEAQLSPFWQPSIQCLPNTPNNKTTTIVKTKSKFVLSIVMGSALAASSAFGANFAFTNGDLILGFQASGGTGNTKNVFFNLGSGVNARNGVGMGTTLGNIGTTLTGVFGSNWYTRSDVWFGVVGNLNNQPTSGIGNRSPVAGDPSRTFYVSKAASTPGSGFLYSASTFTSTALGGAGTNLGGMELYLPNLTAEADGAAILDQSSASNTDWSNSWTVWNPIVGGAQGGSLNTFTGGVQQTFGQAGTETYIDLQRILATNTGASPTGVVGGGTYVTSYSINSTGAITMVPEPSSTLLVGVAGLGLALRRRRNA